MNKEEFNLSEKISAIFSMLQLLDEKVTKTNKTVHKVLAVYKVSIKSI